LKDLKIRKSEVLNAKAELKSFANMAGVTGILLANTEDLGMPQILTT
jgi:hypothetical protein